MTNIENNTIPLNLKKAPAGQILNIKAGADLQDG